MLSLEKGKSQSAQDELAALQASLASLKAENEKLTGVGLGADEREKASAGQIAGLTSDLEKQKNISAEALSKVDLLNQQLVALRRQIAALSDALDLSQKKKHRKRQDHQGSRRPAEHGAGSAGAGVETLSLRFLRPSSRAAERIVRISASSATASSSNRKFYSPRAPPL